MSHYFVNDPKIKSNRKKIEFTFNQHDYVFMTDSGVFSKGEIDYGSIALLNVLVDQDLKKRILDLGCGYGTIGIILKKIFEEANIDMIDINVKAVELSKENCKLNHVINNVFVSDGFNCVDDSYSTVITNPPIRAGKEIIYNLFKDSYEHLQLSGKLYVVMRKSHGAKSAINELENIFGNCKLLAKDQGFHIFVSTKVI